MKIVGCQWDIVWEDREANGEKVRSLLEPIKSADLIVLPEMFSTGYSMHVDRVAEEDPSKSVDLMGSLAEEKGGAVMGGLVRRGVGGKGRNQMVMVDPDRNELGNYCKNKTFTYAGEPDFYERGSEIVNVNWRAWQVTPFICYDLRFPELFRSAVASARTELFVVIASWPSARVEHWLALLRARAIENLAYVIGVNRCGSDPNATYPGRSVIFDPQGELIADAGEGEGLLEAEIDLEVVKAWRSEFPALEDL